MSYEDQSHRFVITGEDPEGHPRTIILWRETDLVRGQRGVWLRCVRWARYPARWNIEVTFFDVKNTLGVGQANDATPSLRTIASLAASVQGALGDITSRAPASRESLAAQCRVWCRRRARGTPMSRPGVVRTPALQDRPSTR
jgi:hypothetical protein